MGADLIVTGLYVMGTMSAKERHDKIMEELELQSGDESWWYEFREAIYQKEFESPTPKEIPGKQIILKAIEAIQDFFDSLGDRDITEIRIPGGKIIIGGGMSWGDSPGEGYDTINLFQSLPEEIIDKGEIHTWITEEEMLRHILVDVPEQLQKELDKFFTLKKLTGG